MKNVFTIGNDQTLARQKGMSLVELMIALVLGLVLTAGVIQVFSGSRMTYMSNDALARVQENGRFAMGMLQPTLRMAGNNGFCSGQVDINNRINPLASDAFNALYALNLPVTGWDYADTGMDDADFELPAIAAGGAVGDWTAGGSIGDLMAQVAARAVPGSDVLMVRGVNACVGITAQDNGNQLGLEFTGATTTPGCPPLQGQVTLVTDCATGADLFQNTSNSGSNLAAGAAQGFNPGNSTGVGSNPWSTDYDEARVFNILIQVFYIGVSNTPNGPEPGLWRMDFSRGLDAATIVNEELVRGVENMQVQYGVSFAAPAGDGRSVNEWVSAADVDDWSSVVSLQLGMLVRSQENADLDLVQQTFDLAGTNVIHAEDRRLRHAFTTNIALRNRMIL